MVQEGLVRFSIQVRTGRAALGWSQAQLAKEAQVARPTIARIEAFLMSPKLETAHKVMSALRKGGVEFVDEGIGSGFTMKMTSESVHKIHEHLIEDVAELQKKEEQEELLSKRGKQ